MLGMCLWFQITSSGKTKYMFFAGWEGRIVKNCDLGWLENAALGRETAGRGQHFQVRGHSFSLYGPTLSRQITFLFFSCDKLAYNWVSETLLLNWFTCRLQTIAKNLTSKRASNSDTRHGKYVLLKNRFISNCLMFVVSSSPVKFSRIVFR